MRWRREQFGAERARRLAELALEGLATLVKPPATGDRGRSRSTRSAATSCSARPRRPTKVLAPSRPSSIPGGRFRSLGPTSTNSSPRASAFRCDRCESSRTRSEPGALAAPGAVPQPRRIGSTPRPNGAASGPRRTPSVEIDCRGDWERRRTRRKAPEGAQRDALDDLIDRDTAPRRTRESMSHQNLHEPDRPGRRS